MPENSSNKKYDFIFLGGGCAALSLLMRMIKSGQFNDKKILLIDKSPKTKNDRTWCFWENENGFFEPIVYRRWNALDFYSDQFSTRLHIEPYQYKMIRGIDFYNYCFGEIRKAGNIECIYGEISTKFSEKQEATHWLDGNRLQLDTAMVFNSIMYSGKKERRDINLLQHFKGLIIEADEPSFNSGTATFMDFRVHQNNGTSFVYVLPFTDRKALVEYTLFSSELLAPAQYDDELKSYIDNILKIGNYKIYEEEFGSIPMTNRTFDFYNNGVYHIGTAGGQTKASSGYTFQFIQKQSEQIVKGLINAESLSNIPSTPNRFRFYDSVLLRLISERKLAGDKIFSRLFQKNKPTAVLKFLDNETSIAEELKLISTLPVWPFLKAAIRNF